MPQGVPNTWWRCNECGLIHFHCGVCYTQRTIPKAWEVSSVPELYRRAQFSQTNLIICDPCWPAVREKTIQTADAWHRTDPDADLMVPPEGHSLVMPPGYQLPGRHA